MLDDEMDAPIFPPAGTGVLETQRPIFPVADCVDIDGKSKFPKVRFHISCSAFAEHEVVRRCSEFVTASFQEQMSDLFLLQMFGIGL